ncbi:MAG TPA: nuclease-related domain-containing protein [Anaerolineales bacterium]|nr:nuclease-related domain-containing protein [Anaerolineales bacterium]
MRIIEKNWVDIHAGFQAVQSLETRLKYDWKRAIQVAQNRETQPARIRYERTKRITAILLMALLPAFVLFCAGVTYLPELRPPLFASFCMLVIPGIVLSLVLVRNFGVAGVPRPSDAPPLDIEKEWWSLLRPKSYVIQKGGQRGEIDFLKSLAFLDDSFIAVWGLLTSTKVRSDTDVLLLGPNGIWIFEVKYWNGAIHKQNRVWSSVYWNGRRKSYEKSPDEQWLHQKDEVSKTIAIQLRNRTWPEDLIKGGVVFAHRNTKFGQIEHPQAAYGKPGAWRKRIQDSKPLDGFSLPDRLQVLDALIRYANRYEREEFVITSASDAANQLYDQAAAALQKYVVKRVK